jgi:preprotein translocase subunit SecG
MGTILLVVYITAAISMIVLILLQRSEGGALGIGGGGGGGLVSGRGAANLLTRITAVLGAIFFIGAIGLGVLSHRTPPSSAVVGGPAKAPAGESTPASEPAPIEQAPSNLPALKLPKFKPETAPAQSSGSAAPTPAAPGLPQLPQSQ